MYSFSCIGFTTFVLCPEHLNMKSAFVYYLRKLKWFILSKTRTTQVYSIIRNKGRWYDTKWLLFAFTSDGIEMIQLPIVYCARKCFITFLKNLPDCKDILKKNWNTKITGLFSKAKASMTSKIEFFMSKAIKNQQRKRNRSDTQSKPSYFT